MRPVEIDMRADDVEDASVARHRTRKTRSLHVPHCRFFLSFRPSASCWHHSSRGHLGLDGGRRRREEEEERAGMPVSRLVKLHIGCFWISWDSFFSAFNSLT